MKYIIKALKWVVSTVMVLVVSLGIYLTVVGVWKDPASRKQLLQYGSKLCNVALKDYKSFQPLCGKGETNE